MDAVTAYARGILDGITTTLKGLRVTMLVMTRRKPVTIQYPDERPVIRPRYRGVLAVDLAKCRLCLACERGCPSSCIRIDVEGKGKERKAKSFVVDFSKCLWCGTCAGECNFEAIYHTQEYDWICSSRTEMLVDFARGPRAVRAISGPEASPGDRQPAGPPPEGRAAAGAQ
jgi:NADH-quinone oxidoreductase subunit I